MPDTLDTALCSNCGYLLRGLPEPVCPECGQSFDPNDPSTYEHAPVTSRQLFILALRVLGFLAVIRTLVDIPYVMVGFFSLLGGFGAAGPPPTAWDLGWILAGCVRFVLEVAFALVLIFRAERIASFFYRIPPASHIVKTIHIDAIVLYKVFCKLLGLYAFLLAIPPAANTAVNTAAALADGAPYPFAMQNAIGQLLQAVLYLAAAALLILGSKRIAGWLAKLRYTPPAEEQSDQNPKT